MSCSCLALTQHLLLLLLVYADYAYSQVHYYITPSPNVHCPRDHCLTLSQFAADSTSYSYIGNEIDIILSFLPGNHSLDRVISLSHIGNFSMMKGIGDNETVLIECSNQSGQFSINNVPLATVKDLHFIGCRGNTITQVELFMVEDTIFQGVESRGTALVLNEVTTANFVRTSFLSNTYNNSGTPDNISNVTSYQDILNYLYLRHNSSIAVGGALYAAFSNISIVSCNFTHNSAMIGGAVFAHNSTLHVDGSTYSYNTASFGGVMVTSESSIDIDNSTFSENVAEIVGGVMITYRDRFHISGTMFINNSADGSIGVLMTFKSLFSITDSIFSDNAAKRYSGVIYAVNGSFSIGNSTFINNNAVNFGGIMCTSDCSFNITSCAFINNSAAVAGAMLTTGSSFNITSSTFTNNSAIYDGGVHVTHVRAYDSLLNIVSSSFCTNEANSFGGIMVTIACSTKITDGKFDHSSGSLYIFNGNLTFSGHTRFKNCKEPSNRADAMKATLVQEGGAITSFQSTVIFTGVSTLSNNQARRGGAILATRSKIMMHGETTIASNTATESSGSGGCISLQQSDLEIKGNCIISHNHATKGGGIHATSSTVAVYQPGTLQFLNNRAENGSGLYLEANPSLYTLKTQASHDEYLLIFSSNHANYGGAIYVADDTNSGACLPDNECFLQTLALHGFSGPNTTNVLFSVNTASEQGANLFGDYWTDATQVHLLKCSKNK